MRRDRCQVSQRRWRQLWKFYDARDPVSSLKVAVVQRCLARPGPWESTLIGIGSFEVTPVVNTNAEVTRLKDLMPASGRMTTRIVMDDRQSTVIQAPFPRPWQRSHPILINWSLWQVLSASQRDVLFLHYVCWLTSVRLLKPELYQGIAAVGLAGTVFELLQTDAIGILAAGGLTTIAATQVWRSSTGNQAKLDADEAAIRIAQRRGYSERDAARHLLEAIEAVPRIEGRGGMSYAELLRTQSLRAILGTTNTPPPTRMRMQ